MNKKILGFLEEKQLNFKDITNLRSPEDISSSDLSDMLFLSDKTVHDFNPSRYKFYINFMEGLNDPEKLKQVLYTNTKIKNKKEEELASIQNIAKGLQRLYIGTDDTKRKNINDNLSKRIKNVVSDDSNKASKELNDTIEQTFKGGGNKSDEELLNTIFIKHVHSDIANITGNLNKIIDLKKDLKKDFEMGHEGGNGLISEEESKKLSETIFEIENDTMKPLNSLYIKTEDRVLFIAITFLIRYISLSFVEWGMNTNFIITFKQTFLFYGIIYVTLFCFITMIVNITYNYPLMQLQDRSIINIQAMLYYFYIYTNGSMRLILHLMFIITLMLIPFIIKLSEDSTDNLSYNYEVKKNTKNVLSRFTLVIWILTSILAIKY